MTKGKGERELDDIDEVFKALSSAARRHILVVLNARGGQMTAGEVASRFSCTWPTTTRNLRILQMAGLVKVERQGREWQYTVDYDRLAAVVGNWMSWFNN